MLRWTAFGLGYVCVCVCCVVLCCATSNIFTVHTYNVGTHSVGCAQTMDRLSLLFALQCREAIFNNNVSIPLSTGSRVFRRIRIYIVAVRYFSFYFSFFSIWFDEEHLPHQISISVAVVSNECYAVRKKARERAGYNSRWQFSVFCLLCNVTHYMSEVCNANTSTYKSVHGKAKQSFVSVALDLKFSFETKQNTGLDIYGEVACTRVKWAFLLLSTFAPTISKKNRNNKTVSFVFVCFNLKQKKNGCSSWSLQRMPSARWLRRSVNNKCWILKRFFFLLLAKTTS